MKALSSKQVLYSILITCAMTIGITVVAFWQYRTISHARAVANQVQETK